LLGLFFGLVIVCGVTLGVGYSLGRNSAKQATAAALSAAPANAAAATASKPGASQAAAPKTPDCTGGDNCPSTAAATTATDLTFYKTVQQKDEHPQLTAAEGAPNGSASSSASSAAYSATPSAASSANPSASSSSQRTTLGAGYLVQIAAVRYQDDARLLSDALHKQQYPVIVTQPGDKLFHVQVGPYADVKEAEAIRSRLVGAGYNAFLKR
jgi:cell division septation protein DedD